MTERKKPTRSSDTAKRGKKPRQGKEGTTLQAMFGLTDREAAFVREYQVDMNATRAAMRAGYSPRSAHVQAFDLLKKPRVAEAMEHWRREVQERSAITQERVLQELAKLAFSDIRNVISWGDTTVREETGPNGETVEKPYHGVTIRNSSDIDPDAAATITEISEGKEGIKVKLADKKGPLELLARHLGMLNDKMKLQGDPENPLRVLHQQISGTSFRPRGENGEQSD